MVTFRWHLRETGISGRDGEVSQLPGAGDSPSTPLRQEIPYLGLGYLHQTAHQGKGEVTEAIVGLQVGEIPLVSKSSTTMVSLSEEIMENSYTGLRTDRQ